MRIAVLRNTDPPPHPTVWVPWKVTEHLAFTLGKKRERERAEGWGREGGKERLLHLSQVRLGARGSPKPFSIAETESGGRGRDGEKGEKNPSMTKRDVADMPATRH